MGKEKIKLNPAPYNPRAMSQEEEARLSASIARFGDLSGIVFNIQTKNLITGHQRVAELTKRGYKLTGTAPDLALKSGDKTFPVRLVDWPLIEEKAANLAANSPAISGKFTHAVLDLIDEIETAMPDLWDELDLSMLNSELDDAEDFMDQPEQKEVPGMELQPFESYDYVAFFFKDERDYNFAQNALGMERVNSTPIPGKRKIGLGRCLNGTRLVELLKKAKLTGGARD